MNDTDIPIWNDADVMRIYQVHDGQPFPMFHMFNDGPQHAQLVQQWITADQQAGSDGPPEAFITACLAGVRLVETLAGSAASGWLKFFIYMTDTNNHFLWDLYHRQAEVAVIADWTVETITGLGWVRTAIPQRWVNGIATPWVSLRRRAVVSA